MNKFDVEKIVQRAVKDALSEYEFKNGGQSIEVFLLCIIVLTLYSVIILYILSN